MAKTVYVRKSGADANSGLTELLAKLTIGGANAIAVAGDTVDIGVGVWTETKTLCGVSNVTYQGASMFRTTYVGDLGPSPNMFVSHIHLLNDIKIAWTSGFVFGYNYSGGYQTMNRVYHDFAAVPLASIYGVFYISANLNSTYRNNIFTNYGCCTDGLFASYGDGTNSTIKFYNCVFARNANSGTVAQVPGVYWNYNSSNAVAWVKNCIFHTCAPQYYNFAGGFFDTASAHVHTNNRYYNVIYSENITTRFDATESIADPVFEDAAGGDFRLQTDSPCIGVGTGALA